jgi:hypothetical protein
MRVAYEDVDQVPQEAYGPADTYTPSELDDVLFLPEQDVHEPLDESEAELADITAVEDVNDQFDSPGEIRTAFGHLDFLNNIVEETSAVLDHHKAPAPKVKQPKLDAIKTRSQGSDTFKARTARIDLSSVDLVSQSDKRRSLVIVNYGPGVLYISAQNPQAGTGQPNQFPIPVSNPTVAGQYYPHTLTTKDRIYAVASVTATVVSTFEEFDMEE